MVGLGIRSNTKQANPEQRLIRSVKVVAGLDLFKNVPGGS
jgi:hypothetical protein